jgi:pimeloyl-ACP methyl ester carboxylesterase
MHRIPVIALLVLLLSQSISALAQSATPASSPSAPSAASGDFAGLVDIGGRSLYLECRGEGSPTVILVAGYRASARFWTDDLLQPDAPRQMAMPGVTEFTRVCTYDRPGTIASIGEEILPSRSDPITQPRTSPEVVAELHALLDAAQIPGPYVLVGHSMGGFFARLYAATYPDEVIGLVLVDAYSEQTEILMTPERWEAMGELSRELGSDTVVPIPGYGDLETLPWGVDNALMREAAAASPLPPMPLAVLAHGKAIVLLDDTRVFTTAEWEALQQASYEALATLVPQARFTVASESGHDIHQDQPEVVIEATRQVLEGVRTPETWYELASCCAT